MDDLHRELVATLVRLGQQLEAIEARSGVMSDPEFPEWFAEHGGAQLLAERLGRPLSLMTIHLFRLAARERPGWLDPAAVDLGDPLAGQLIEAAHGLRDA